MTTRRPEPAILPEGPHHLAQHCGVLESYRLSLLPTAAVEPWLPVGGRLLSAATAAASAVTGSQAFEILT